jgi:hypothetical protein
LEKARKKEKAIWRNIPVTTEMRKTLILISG